jgi:hypothetical protein
MNKFLSAIKSKIVWIVIGVIALVTLLAIMLYQYYLVPLIPTRVLIPPAILQIQGMEQKGALNIDCDGCENLDGFGTPGKALRVNSPLVATLEFSIDTPPSEFSIDTPPNEVSIRVHDASRLKEISTTWTFRSWDFDHAEGSIVLEKELAPKKEQTFSLELNNGLYVIYVSAGWEYEWGEKWASYGFLVEVSDCVSIFCFR